MSVTTWSPAPELFSQHQNSGRSQVGRAEWEACSTGPAGLGAGRTGCSDQEVCTRTPRGRDLWGPPKEGLLEGLSELKLH